MKLKDLIKDKDYDYIEIRNEIPEEIAEVEKTYFVGACKSLKGKIISLDGDNYSVEMEVTEYKEWITNNIKAGLTIICKETHPIRSRKRKLQFIIDTYGTKAQEDIAIEECSELIKAICKNRRNPSDETRKGIIDEMADVEIMIEQLKIIHSCSREVEERIDYKIERQIDRIMNK